MVGYVVLNLSDNKPGHFAFNLIYCTINSAVRWAGDLAKFMGAAPGTPGYRGMASGAPRRQENLVLMRMGGF